jgi:hypothetical protein
MASLRTMSDVGVRPDEVLADVLLDEAEHGGAAPAGLEMEVRRELAVHDGLLDGEAEILVELFE